jgi:two-component sensor histidine kinase
MDGSQQALTVTDDGDGLPPGFDAAQAGSLGLRIVHSMARQLGGQFEMIAGDRGVSSRLVFPVEASEAPAVA